MLDNVKGRRLNQITNTIGAAGPWQEMLDVLPENKMWQGKKWQNC